MKNILFLSFISLFILGCSTKQTSDYSSKEYVGINKDALLNAAKTVIKLSDKDFAIDSKRTSLEAIKISPIHKGFTVDLNVNTINMMVFPDENITRAKVKFVHKNNILAQKETILKGSIHDLFWNRVDYILGLNNTWPTCMAYRLQLNADGILCDIIHNQNTQPSNKNILQDVGFYKPKDKAKTPIQLATIDIKDMFAVVLPMHTMIKNKEVNQTDQNQTENFLDMELTFEDKQDNNNSLELSKDAILEEVLEDLNTTKD